MTIVVKHQPQLIVIDHYKPTHYGSISIDHEQMITEVLVMKIHRAGKFPEQRIANPTNIITQPLLNARGICQCGIEIPK